MEYRNIIDKILESLKNDFNSIYSEEEIDNLKNNPMNMFYNEFKNKYTYLLTKYIENNMYLYLKEYYEDNNCSYEIRLNILKWMYNSSYNFILFDDFYTLVPKEFSDLKFYEKMLEDKKFSLISNVLYTSKFKSELFFAGTKTINYQSLFNKDFKDFLIKYSNTKAIDINIYDKLFDDLCVSDKYAYNIVEFLSNDCLFVDSINLGSLLKNLYLYNDLSVNEYFRKKRSDLFYEEITGGRINIVNDNIGYLLMNIKYFRNQDNIENKELVKHV